MLAGVGDIHHHPHAIQAVVFQIGANLFRTAIGSGSADDLGSLAAQLQRDLLADTATGTGDKCNFVFQ